MDRQAFLKLLSPEGHALLNSIAELDTKTDVVKVVSRLRKDGHDPELIATVLTQVKLRRQAKAKFGEFAQTMLFSQSGLEQASRLQVAAIHAGRFRQAGISNVADLGCGIGAESLALASLDINVTAFELDELTAAIASYNLANFENVTVEQADVTKVDLSGFAGLLLDPSRRDSKSRKYDPATFSPSYDFVLTAARTKPTIVKLGPGMPHDMIPDDAEAVWVSVNGDLVELTLYFGKVRRGGVARAALLITEQGSFELSSALTKRTDAQIGELEKYIYEPDNAAIRSHLLGELANPLGLKIFSPEIAYLTSSSLVNSPWLKRYELIADLPFDRKKLRAELNARNIGPIEIKKRGADITPENLRRELNLKGNQPATLIVTRVARGHRALLVKPL